MTVVIAMRTKSDRGTEILDEFEALFNIRPLQVIDDGTRRYQRDAEDAKLTDYNPMLDKVDRDWRDHIEPGGYQLESELDEELDQEELDEAWEEAGED